MPRKVRCTLALLMLTLFLGAGAAHALPSEGPSVDRAPGMLAALWNWVTSVVETKVPLFQVHEADGQILPLLEINGGPEPDGGGSMDPNG